jgi:hypothetical protein
MKNFNKFMLPVAALLIGFTSCTPDEAVTPTPTPTPTPTAPPPPTPTIAGVNGAMIALQLDFNYTVSGISVPFNTEMGIAAFYNTVGDATMVDAGTVKVNNVALTRNTTNSAYLVTAGIPTQEPSTLNLDGNISWNVAGNTSTNMPADNYNIDATVYPFPNYTGTIPTEITRANGLSLTFNSTTVTGTDSVYVMIISGSGSILKAFHKNAGPVMISATDLNTLSASSTSSPAYIEIVPFRVMGYTNPMGKVYAYVNEKAIVRSITLN